MRVAIAGGGTGGHVYPALAAAEALRDAGAEILFVGTARGLEARAVPAAGFRLATVGAAPMPRGGRALLDLPRAAWANLSGAVEADRALGAFGPDVLLGVGGYVSVPAILAARRRGVPVVLHEQNVLPGMANRLLARLADAVALSWEASRRWIDGPRVRVVGNPVRRDVRDADRASARLRRGLSADRVQILVFGGSRGARRLNGAVPGLVRRLADEGRDVATLWATGRDLHDEARAAAAGAPGVEVVPYIEAMGEALAAADLLVSRAGATTLAEAAARGVASVLVPYPHAAEGHQSRNAEAFAAAGAARVVEDAACDAGGLYAALAPWLDDAAARRGAGAAAWTLARPRAAEDLAALVLETARGAARVPSAASPARRAARTSTGCRRRGPVGGR